MVDNLVVLMVDLMELEMAVMKAEHSEKMVDRSAELLDFSMVDLSVDSKYLHSTLKQQKTKSKLMINSKISFFPK